MKETTITRAEHLQWCKDRALEYCDIGDTKQAFLSMASDLTKHPETQMHTSTIGFGLAMLMAGHLQDVDKMREFINGFN